MGIGTIIHVPNLTIKCGISLSHYCCEIVRREPTPDMNNQNDENYQ
jgi:hypothetical protein